MKTLTELAHHYHCDKVEHHNYLPLYERLLAHRLVKRLLEVGVGYRGMMEPYVKEYVHGASLKMWRDYFTDAQIYGMDNRPDTMFTDERITTLLVDERDQNELDALASKYGPFDVIVHDGSHDIEDQVDTFRMLWPHVAEFGIYLCEDVQDAKRLADVMDGKIYYGGKTHDDYVCWVEKS